MVKTPANGGNYNSSLDRGYSLQLPVAYSGGTHIWQVATHTSHTLTRMKVCNQPNVHVFGLWAETGGPEKTQTGTGRTPKVHICSRDLQLNPKPFFGKCKWQFRCRAGSIDAARKDRDKRLGAPVKIRCIKEPSRRKAQGSSSSLHHNRQFKVKRRFRWQYVSQSPSLLNEMSEAHQHLTICAPDWENVTAAFLKCFFELLSTELSVKSYILTGHFVM